MICEYPKCSNIATDQHHKFPQTKLNKRLYPEYIHHPDNIKFYCNGCHLNNPIEKWTEKQFCDHFGIEPRSKSGRQKWAKKILVL